MAIMAFSGCFYILNRNNNKDSVIKSVMSTYELMLGGFDTSKYGSVGYPLIYIVFAFAALFLIVIMLNLLIAIISDTYAAVQENREVSMYQEFTKLICESRHLLSKRQSTGVNQQGNYLFVASLSQGGSEESDAPEKVD